MGPRHLYKLLHDLCLNRGVYKYSNVSEFLARERTNSPYVVAIDANLYAVKYKRVFDRIEYGFLKQVTMTLRQEMIPIYVFDGHSPKGKGGTIQKRREKQQKIIDKLNDKLSTTDFSPNIGQLDFGQLLSYINIMSDTLNKNDEIALVEDDLIDDDTQQLSDPKQNMTELNDLTIKSRHITTKDITNLKRFFTELKIPFITAQGEADDMIATLYQKGIIDVCQSDDMDMLPKGCHNLIQINNTGVTQFVLTDILETIHLTYEQFVDLCILLGSDYYVEYYPKLKPMELFMIFCLCPSLEEFVTYYSKTDDKIESHLIDYQGVRKFFIGLDEKMDANEVIKTLHIDPLRIESVKNYFRANKLLLGNQYYLINSINKLNKQHEEPK